MSFNFQDRDREYCRHMVESFNYIKRYIIDYDHTQFLMDSRTQDAVAMRLQQILECAIKLSIEAKTQLKINWSSLIAMRNKISHSYVDIDPDIVWQVVNEFDEFKNLIEWAKSNVAKL